MQPFAYDGTKLTQFEIQKELEELSKDPILASFEINTTLDPLCPPLDTATLEKLYELLFIADMNTLCCALYLPDEADLFKVAVLAYAYAKDRFPFAVRYNDFETFITDFKRLKMLYSVAWSRHLVNNRLRNHTEEWLRKYPEDDEKLCHSLLEAYNVPFMPIHSILRIAHPSARSQCVGAMFAVLVNKCTAEQRQLLPKSVQERLNFLTL